MNKTMSMTLEQVIADCKEEISNCRIDLNGITELLEEYPERKEAFAHEIDNYKKRMDYNRQLATWLRELKERRKAPEIVRCGECKHNGTHNCLLNLWATIFNSKPKDDFFCGMAERRTDG